MPSLDQLQKESLNRRRFQLLISIPIILLPLIFAIVSIFSPSTFYNIFHKQKLINNKSPIILGLDFQGGMRVIYEVSENNWVLKGEISNKLNETKRIITKRLTDFGNFEPSINIVDGSDQLILEIPGITDYEKITNIIGQTGNLEIFSLKSYIDINSIKLMEKISDSLLSELVLSKEDLESIDLEYQPNIRIQVQLKDDSRKKVFSVLARNAGGNVVIVINNVVHRILGVSDTFQESRYDLPNAITNDVNQELIISNDEGMSLADAQDLKTLLEWDVLPVNLNLIERNKIGPILSAEKFNYGVSALLLGIILIIILMLIFYGTYLGTIGSIALLYCITLIYGIFNVTGLILNLPGLAGLILTVGISVDSFILIFEAIKETIRDRMDSNLEPFDEETIWVAISNIAKQLWTLRMTTVVGMSVLLLFTGPIKGFAITMIVGIIISLIVSSRPIIGGMLIILQNYGKKISRFNYGIPIFENSFIEKIFRKLLSKKFLIQKISLLFIILSIVIIYRSGFNIGLDFKNGTQLEIQVEKPPNGDILKSIIEDNFNNRDLQCYSVQPIQTSLGGSVYLVKTDVLSDIDVISIVEVLNKNGYQASIQSELTVNSKVGKNQLKAWVAAVVLSTFVVFIYCLLPFAKVKILEHKLYPALVSILAILHDIFILLGVISIFRIELSVAVITGILLLIGYSINDSLILIYKINNKIKKDKSTTLNPSIIDDTVIQIRSRTLNTTITTMVGLFPILLTNIDFIKPFIITVLLGLIIGTYSSIFFVDPLLENMLNKRRKVYFDKIDVNRRI